MNFYDFLSIFALIVSSVSLVISWMQFSRDSGQLKLNLDFSIPPVGGGLHLVITNIGRRPITVRNIYLHNRQNERFILPETNILLEETESRKITISVSGYIEKSPLELKFIEVIDTRGKGYKASMFWLRPKMKQYLHL